MCTCWKEEIDEWEGSGSMKRGKSDQKYKIECNKLNFHTCVCACAEVMLKLQLILSVKRVTNWFFVQIFLYGICDAYRRYVNEKLVVSGGVTLFSSKKKGGVTLVQIIRYVEKQRSSK